MRPAPENATRVPHPRSRALREEGPPESYLEEAAHRAQAPLGPLNATARPRCWGVTTSPSWAQCGQRQRQSEAGQGCQVPRRIASRSGSNDAPRFRRASNEQPRSQRTKLPHNGAGTSEQPNNCEWMRKPRPAHFEPEGRTVFLLRAARISALRHGNGSLAGIASRQRCCFRPHDRSAPQRCEGRPWVLTAARA